MMIPSGEGGVVYMEYSSTFTFFGLISFQRGVTKKWNKNKKKKILVDRANMHKQTELIRKKTGFLPFSRI